MAYATDAHVRGIRATFAYNAADVAAIRSHTRDPSVPIHMIGGLSNAMGAGETAGFMSAVTRLRPARLQPVRVPGHQPGRLDGAHRTAGSRQRRPGLQLSP